jgi:predicted nucleotidyltransferase component of viral defense system
VRNFSKEKNIEAEIILRNYMLERLLERISLSQYCENFILKGGMLIAAMVGIDTRATMDMDATIKGQVLNNNEIQEIFNVILSQPIDDNVTMILKSFENISDETEYPCVRVSIEAILDKTRQILKVDITTGDKITPREINYSFNLMFEDRTINIKAYNLETVLAEKLETVVVRGITNTRMRDFYDIYILTTLQSDNINGQVFDQALKSTATKRGTLGQLQNNAEQAIESVENNNIMQNLWKRYQKKYKYAVDIEWCIVMKSVKTLWKLSF